MKQQLENGLTWDDFMKVEMRVGTVLSAEPFEEAHKPAYKLLVDFGPQGIRKTSAQITHFYKTADLIGRQVVGVVNFPPKQIANMKSECLILGAVGPENWVVLLEPERKVTDGMRIG
jgi:tRNA-binding protein